MKSLITISPKSGTEESNTPNTLSPEVCRAIEETFTEVAREYGYFLKLIYYGGYDFRTIYAPCTNFGADRLPLDLDEIIEQTGGSVVGYIL